MISQSLKSKLEKVKLLAMDVDGTLTDASMYYGEKGETMKRFSTRDGMGITLLKCAGLKTAIVTSEINDIVIARSEKLRIDFVEQGCKNKSEYIFNLAEKLSMTIENIAYIGDDVNDIEALKAVGASACPSDAAKVILSVVDYICTAKGGNGAVREFCEAILLSQNKQIVLPKNW